MYMCFYLKCNCNSALHTTCKCMPMQTFMQNLFAFALFTCVYCTIRCFFLLWLIAELHNPGLFRSVLNVWPFLWTSHLISNSPQDNISQFIHNPKFQLVRGFNMFQLFQFFSTIHKGFFVETSIPLSEKFSGISPLLRKKTWWYTTSLSCLTCRSCRSRSTHWRLLSTWAISIGISTKKHAITHWIWIRWSEFVVYHGFQIGTHFFLTQRMRFDKRSQSARVRT